MSNFYPVQPGWNDQQFQNSRKNQEQENRQNYNQNSAYYRNSQPQSSSSNGRPIAMSGNGRAQGYAGFNGPETVHYLQGCSNIQQGIPINFGGTAHTHNQNNAFHEQYGGQGQIPLGYTQELDGILKNYGISAIPTDGIQNQPFIMPPGNDVQYTIQTLTHLIMLIIHQNNQLLRLILQEQSKFVSTGGGGGGGSTIVRM
ncbi:hypothetical protein [Metabacillus arenae]|uniref:Uncharacterized protein n=1 Tax=Metabacillus arenae TaxID=2771434 RepID=A0A926NN72_9BACI|nr:hypothetical protein [Metabacillus arenae]MBD1381072.1 hypothetical protein [Metabacillus arenae]